jgi:dsRNA-specific ribonuclease
MNHDNETNLFVQLKEAAENISQAFNTIIEIAPNRKLYNTLVDSQGNPFLQSVLQTPADIDLNDEKIKFAVQVKELYDNGHLEIVKCLINGNDIDSFIANNIDTKTPVASSKSSEDKNSNDIGFNMDHIDSSLDGARNITHTESNTIKKNKSSENVGEERGFEVQESDTDPTELKAEGEIENEIDNGEAKENQNQKEKEKDDADADADGDEDEDDDHEDISELFTSEVASAIEVSKDNLHIHKRNRIFDVLKVEAPPKLPVINDDDLLHKVFTHQSVMSYLNIPEQAKVQMHNERLEFLGDAFLQFVSSMIIYEKFPNFNEGQLSMLRSQIVSNNRLLKLSQIYGFDKQLRKNINDTSIIVGNNKIYADVFEAYLGAIAEKYMMETAEGETNVGAFMKGWFKAKDWLEELCEDQLRSYDPSLVFKMQYCKSSKQDLRLLLGQLNIPEYIRCNLSNRRILSCVKVTNKIYGYGIGTSNKEADARAATDAISNPGIKKICPSDLWKKYEDTLGLDENGGLKIDQIPTMITPKDMDILRKEIAIKYKNGKIKLLISKNNPISLLIDDKQRALVNEEMEAKHAIDNNFGELVGINTIENKDTNNEEEDDDASTNKTRDSQNKRLKDSSKLNGKENKDSKEKDDSNEHYYSKEYTMGRGGVFGDEFQRIRKGSTKQKGGICRNGIYEIMDIAEGGVTNRGSTRSLACHEVLVKLGNVDMDSKNRINAVFAKRGGIPDYMTYKTVNDEYLCELWFSNRQIVSYGLDKNKRMASQKAAMLAWKREEFYGYEDDSD